MKITITKWTCKKEKNANKTYFMVEKIFKNKNIKETKIKTKEHNNRQNVNRCIRNWDSNKEIYKAI